MSSRGSCWRSGVRCRGRRCRPCRSRSCCCRGGFRSTSTRSATGRARRIVPLLVIQTLPARAEETGADLSIAELFVVPPDQITPLARGRAPEGAVGLAFRRHRPRAACSPIPSFRDATAPARDQGGRGFHARAAERRRRPRRDLSVDGQQPADVRRCSAIQPDDPHVLVSARVDRAAARHPRRRSLLPALRLAGLGHGAVVPCAAGSRRRGRRLRRPAKGLEWLRPRQVLDVKGDWAAQKPDVRPGGWAFQYANPHYPDLDDTAVVVMAMDRARSARPMRAAIARAREWVEGLQSRDGGWAAFDADNSYHYLNNIPFADHGALLDPPTEDVTARCVSMLAQLGETAETSPGDGARHRLSAPTQREGRQLVRPLGPELHLRHLVGAVRAQCRRRSDRDPRRCGAPSAGCSRSRTRTAAGARAATATGSTTPATGRLRRRRRRRPGRCSA